MLSNAVLEAMKNPVVDENGDVKISRETLMILLNMHQLVNDAEMQSCSESALLFNLKTREGMRLYLLSEGVVKVKWATYWHDDETHTQEPQYFNDKGNRKYPNIDDGDFEELIGVWNMDNGVYRLDVRTNEIKRLGSAYIPEPDIVLEGWDEDED